MSLIFLDFWSSNHVCKNIAITTFYVALLPYNILCCIYYNILCLALTSILANLKIYVIIKVYKLLLICVQQNQKRFLPPLPESFEIALPRERSKIISKEIKYLTINYHVVDENIHVGGSRNIVWIIFFFKLFLKF